MTTEHCRCWEYSHALGHDGHCCFLTDDRKGWRRGQDICHAQEWADRRATEETP